MCSVNCIIKYGHDLVYYTNAVVNINADLFDGKFADIQITADADTASFRSAFEQIVNKILPYISAQREQLTRSRITNNELIGDYDENEAITIYFIVLNNYCLRM